MHFLPELSLQTLPSAARRLRFCCRWEVFDDPSTVRSSILMSSCLRVALLRLCNAIHWGLCEAAMTLQKTDHATERQTHTRAQREREREREYLDLLRTPYSILRTYRPLENPNEPSIIYSLNVRQTFSQPGSAQWGKLIIPRHISQKPTPGIWTIQMDGASACYPTKFSTPHHTRRKRLARSLTMDTTNLINIT